MLSLIQETPLSCEGTLGFLTSGASRDLYEKLIETYGKPIKIGGGMLGNIQPMCSNLGHSWQCVFSAKSKHEAFWYGFAVLQDQFVTVMGYTDAD